MKLPALLLAGSLAINLAFVGALAFRPSLASPSFRNFFARNPAGQAASPIDAKALPASATTKGAPASAPLWPSLQTDDLPGLVARLRAAGFPNSAIRAIIQSAVDVRFVPRALEFTQVDPNVPFWKATASLGSDSKRTAEYLQLINERSKLLRDLLGNLAGREDGEITTAQRRRYGNISAAKVDAIDGVTADYSEMTNLVRAGTNGIMLPEDREKLALLDREKHADLAAILTPQELEDYEMRSSPVTSRLRATFDLFKASDDEFRTIYRIEAGLADKINPTALGVLPADFMQQRTAAQDQLRDQLKAALGDDRYAEFARSSDRDYQQLSRLESSESLPPGSAVQAYSLRDNLSRESNRIFDDATLTVDERRTALQSLAQNTRAQLLATLGPTAGETYVKSASWLANVERGGAVTFTESSTSFRSLPAAARPGARGGGTGGGGGGGVR